MNEGRHGLLPVSLGGGHSGSARRGVMAWSADRRICPLMANWACPPTQELNPADCFGDVVGSCIASEEDLVVRDEVAIEAPLEPAPLNIRAPIEDPVLDLSIGEPVERGRGPLDEPGRRDRPRCIMASEISSAVSLPSLMSQKWFRRAR